MDSILAHACIIDLFASQETVLPDRWSHDLTDGSLSYGFGDSPNTFTWDAKAVASLAARAAGEPTSPGARSLLDTWATIRHLTVSDGLRDPDRLLFEDRDNEVTLVWEAEKVVMIVERA